MRAPWSSLTLAALALAAATPSVQAQEKATELTAGIVGLSVTSAPDWNESLTEFATGGAYVAAGIYVTPEFAIEPTVSLYHASSDGDGFTNLALGVAFPYYTQKGWGRKGPYIAPRFIWSQFDCTACTAESQFGLGMAVGVKLPLNEAAALRLQGAFDYGFENEDFPKTTTFGASLGLSVFLK